MQRKKAVGGLLAMGLLLALATMALVYTNWGQNLTINGSVTTGSVDVKAIRVCDIGTGVPGDPPCTLDNEGVGAKVTKDIGSCVFAQPSAKKFTVTITNGYPGYKCHFWINVTNNSKLPVSVSHAISALPTGIKVTPVADGAWDAVAKGYPPLLGTDGLPTTFPKGNCTEAQLGLNETTFCDFDVAVNKTAAQGTTSPFTIDVSADLLNKPAS